MTPRRKAGGVLTSLRKGFAGRVASWLCVAIFAVTLFGPVSVALAADPVLDAIAASVCHAAALEDEGEGEVEGAKRTHGPHCPLCLVGGGLWLPSSRVPEPVRLIAEAEALIPPADLNHRVATAGTIRPATRAPPALI